MHTCRRHSPPPPTTTQRKNKEYVYNMHDVNKMEGRRATDPLQGNNASPLALEAESSGSDSQRLTEHTSDLGCCWCPWAPAGRYNVAATLDQNAL